MASPESLLEHTQWLRRLAAGLVGDRSIADDLAQDTWVAALRRPPEANRSLQPWLARVLRNAARFRWRSDANRAAREAAVAAHAETHTPTSEELLDRHALQQQLATLVGELAEPFRATILLRYAEGLEPTQIARRLGIPAGTVRWRIQEGLARLRRALDDAHRGDRKAWRLALAPIAAWPRVSRAATTVGIGAAVVAAVAIAIVVRSGWLRTTAGASEPPRPARGALSLALVGSPPAGTSASWLVQPGAPARHLTGRVVRGGEPVADAQVRLISDDAAPVETRTDAAGRFDLGAQAARTVSLGAAAPDVLGAIRHLDLRDPAIATDVELPLLACTDRVAGTVTDASGTPIAHARVLREDTIGTETDSAGAYELCTLPTAALVAQLDLVVRADGYGAIAAGVAPAGRMRRDFVLAPEATITGTAAPNAAIWLEPDRDDTTRATERALRQTAIADRDGRFLITGASGGRYQLGGAAPGLIAVGALLRVEPGATTTVTIQMTPAATVRGHVLVHGQPVSGAHVAVRSGPVALRHDDPARDAVAAGHAVTQADGSFVLDGVPVGLTTFSADPVRITSAPSRLVAGDNELTLEAEPLGRIRGVVRRHGVPVPFARVDMNGDAKRGLTTDGAGAFELAGLEPGTYSFYADDQRRGAVTGGAPPAVIVGAETVDHDLELSHGAVIAGVVTDGAGASVGSVTVRFTAADGEQARCTADASGAFACGGLRGGQSYVPTVLVHDDAARPLPFVAAAPPVSPGLDAAVAGVRLVVAPATRSIRGTVVDETGAAAVDVRVSARGAGLPSSSWIPPPTVTTDDAGRFHFDQLAPGDYELVAETLHDGRVATRVVAAGSNDAVLALARPPACAAEAPVVPTHRPVRPIVWDDRIELVGWDVPASARVGEPVAVSLVFRVRAPIAHAWQVFAHFDSPERRQLADHAPVSAACPTSTWRPGDVLVDRFATTLPVAGPFTLKVGFFRHGEGDAPYQDLAGAGEVDGVDLATVIVERPN